MLRVVGESPSPIARRATFASQWDRRVADVEHHAALLRRPDLAPHAPVGAEHLLGVAVEDVRGDVTRVQLVEDLGERDGRVGDVHHETDAGQVGRLPRPPERLSRVGLVPLPCRAVGDADLDADDERPVLGRGPRRLLDLGEVDVRQLGHDPVDHEPGRADVQERVDTRPVGRDHVVAEPGERHPPGAPRVHHRGDAVGQRRLIGVAADIEAVVDVGVDVDQPRGHEGAGRVDHLGPLAGQRLRHGRHLAAAERDVPLRRDGLRGIDQRSAANDEVPARVRHARHSRGPSSA